MQMATALAQCVAGAAGLFLKDDFILRKPLLSPHVSLDLVRKVMNNDHDTVHLHGQGAENPIEDRPAANNQQRLRSGQSVRAQSSAETGGEYDSFHAILSGRVRGEKG